MRRLLPLLAVLCLPLSLSPASAERVFGPETAAARPLSGWVERGTASWYGGYFNGRKTSSGVVFDTMAPMAAHKTLPFGTTARVTNLANGRMTWVVIRDRGPFVRGRIIDLSVYSARQLGMVEAGTAPVKVEAVR